MISRGFLISATIVSTIFFAIPAYAATDMKAEIDQLNSQVKDKRDQVKALEQSISGYKKQIDVQESKQASLENETALLDNRIAKKQLDIQRAKLDLDATQLEIESLQHQIEDHEARIGKQLDYSAEIIRAIHKQDSVSAVEIILTKHSLSQYFTVVEEMKRLEGDLTDALVRLKDIRKEELAVKVSLEERTKSLNEEKHKLRVEELALEAEKNFKESLIGQTKMKQSEFERMLYELKEQQQNTSDSIASLELKLKDKLNTVDESLARGDVLLNWPVDPSRGITATFHDPTYPFKNLFQHPGVDVRAGVGTTIKSAAGGYVAWNKQGRLYGNYVMVVHPGNIATVYAHLSKFLAKADTYIERGDPIGLSGGRPGDPGAGMSTGPHLHFEVRQNGIPVDPQNYLPSVSSE